MALSSGPWDGEIIIWIGSKLNHIYPMRGFPGGSVVKNPPAKQEIQIQSRGQEDPLEEEMATHSSILAWGNPWTEEPGGLQSTGLQRVGHDLATKPLLPSLWRGGAEGYLIHTQRRWYEGRTETKMEKLYTVSKNQTRSCLLLRSWTPYCQIQI